MSIYNVGVGKECITYLKVGGSMQGFSERNQIVDGILETDGVKHDLFARSFVIEDLGDSKNIVVMTVVDLWSCTEALKVAVLEKLNLATKDVPKNTFTEKNVQIMGTHTHSGPAGLSKWPLYSLVRRRLGKRMYGFDPKAVDTVSTGIVKSIISAYKNKARGKIYLNFGQVEGEAGRNRSVIAFLRNEDKYKALFPEGVNREMVLLAFWHVNARDQAERAIGCLNWYGIHPTDLGQTNTKISGDSKGWAALIVEADEKAAGHDGFVSGFANSSHGDVSGNVRSILPPEFRQPPDMPPLPLAQFAPTPPTGGPEDIERLKVHGDNQARAAQKLYGYKKEDNRIMVEVKGEEINGGIEYFFVKQDMSNIRIDNTRQTYIGALGLSMFAGSTEDGNPRSGLREGIREGEVSVTERSLQLVIIAGTSTTGVIEMSAGLTSIAITSILKQISGLNAKPITILNDMQRLGQLPKPITLITEGVAPKELPLQILKLGNVLIAGFPAEPTTVASYKLQETLAQKAQEVFSEAPKKVVISSCTNAYSQYVTTEEEYQAQHYEGASTLFGPHTLAAYQQEFAALLTRRT